MTTPASSSSTKAKANGTPEAPPPPEWLSWPTERQAAKSLSTSNTQLRAIVEKLGLSPVKAYDGSNRYSPTLIAEVQRVLVVAEEVADDDDAPAVVSTERTVVHELIGMVREQRAHIQSLMGLVTGPMTKMLETYDRHHERSEARIATLEGARDEAQRLRSEMLDDQEARSLLKQEMTGKLERRKEMFEEFKKKLPGILDAVETGLASTLGFKAGVDVEKAKAGVALLQSLDPAQLAVLVDPSMTILNAEQRALVRKILGLADEAKSSNEAKASESEPKPTTEKEK